MSRRLLFWGVGALLGLGVLLPLAAFGVVPILVRSSLQEPAPRAAGAPASAPDSAGAIASTPAPASATPLLSGELRKLDPVHHGSGRVSVVEASSGRVLRFENVEIAAAPNMYVYLSDHEDGQPGRFTDLGALRATSGSFNYELPASLDLSQVHSVVVWCRAFSVTVTFASLSTG